MPMNEQSGEIKKKKTSIHVQPVYRKFPENLYWNLSNFSKEKNCILD